MFLSLSFLCYILFFISPFFFLQSFFIFFIFFFTSALSRGVLCFLFLRFLSGSVDAAECMDLLEEMERQQKGLSDENAVLRTENESYQGEIGRLTAILAAREQVTTDKPNPRKPKN